LITHSLAGILFQVKALDPFVFAAVSAVLLLVAALASLVPAYRASRLDPIETLRMN
jgi:putative ABC transport system permease protein